MSTTPPAGIILQPQRQLASFIADVTVEEQHSDRIVMTEHPVEEGALITDHAYKLPAEVLVTIGWNTNGANASSSDNADESDGGLDSLGNTYLRQIYQSLLDLQNNRQVFSVNTGKRYYPSMMLESISLTTDQHTENALLVRCLCREIIYVRAQTVQLAVSSDPTIQTSPEKSQAPVAKGTQNVAPSTNWDDYDFVRGYKKVLGAIQ